MLPPGRGTGTELDLCVKAVAQLRAEGKNMRVVSMPAACRKRLVVEASSSFGWHYGGNSLSIDRYGTSAPGPLLLEKVSSTHQRIGQGKLASCASAVISTRPSSSAWAASMRSNGSRWGWL